VLVGTTELTRLKNPNCALRSEIPEIFKRRIVLIRSVSFPFPDQQHLYTVHRRKNFVLLLFFSVSFLYFIKTLSSYTGRLYNYHSHRNRKLRELLLGKNTKCDGL